MVFAPYLPVASTSSCVYGTEYRGLLLGAIPALLVLSLVLVVVECMALIMALRICDDPMHGHPTTPILTTPKTAWIKGLRGVVRSGYRGCPNPAYYARNPAW